jgi:acetyltransferase-like isoleucine patch superfamily enzyme
MKVPERRPNKWLSLFAWLLPNCRFKLWALRSLGNQIGSDVVLGPNLVVGCGRFEIADGAAIMQFNTFRALSRVELGPLSHIGNFNYFSAAPDYQQFSPWVGRLMIGEGAIITNRHYFDCSGQVILGPYAAVSGLKCILQTHELDLADNISGVGRIVLESKAVASTGCILLKDSYLPEKSVLAAGSVLVRPKEGADMPASGLYGGSPARFIKERDKSDWWDRADVHTPVTAFDDEKFRLQ